MFTPDEVSDGGPVLGALAECSEEILRLFDHFKTVEFVTLNVMNPIIEVDGDAATGDWHAIVTSTSGAGKDRQAIWNQEKYKEEYVRTKEG